MLVRGRRADFACGNSKGNIGFTLVELLVAMAVLALLMVLILSVVDQTGRIYKSTVAKSDQFRAARTAFTSLTQHLKQATLNTYLDYDNPSKPTAYLRKSDLHFLAGEAATLTGSPSAGPTHGVFFQAPLGFSPGASADSLPDLLNALGYFIEFSDTVTPQYPAFVPNKAPVYRFRLMEFKQPTANLSIFHDPATWLPKPLSSASTAVRPIADNIIALVIAPRKALAEAGAAIAPDYTYDSKSAIPDPLHQPEQSNKLPALLDVTMVAISEDSAKLLADQNGSTAPQIVPPDAKFEAASDFSNDMLALTRALESHVPPINYRVFTTTIQLREAK